MTSQLTKEIRKTRYAWAMYFQEMNRQHEANVTSYEARATQIETYVDVLPLHLLKEMRDLLKKDKQHIDCPICLEIIPNDNLQITTCGHKYCKACFHELANATTPKCAVCRKPIKLHNNKQ